MKNAKSSLKKLTKSLEKEREKLTELEATPERCQKEIAEMEKKLKILEVCKMSQCERAVYTCVCVCAPLLRVNNVHLQTFTIVLV